MDEKTRLEVTARNENSTKQWYEANGFESIKLDVDNKGKATDWFFHRSDIAFLCEVKTIFSGAQSGTTRDQYERRVNNASERLERAKREIPPDTILLATREELDFAAGKIPYQSSRNDKEDAYNQFCEEIRLSLIEDQRIKDLPFDLTISFSSLYVEYDKKRKKEFIDWLVRYVLWAQQHHSTSKFPASYSHAAFTLVPSTRKSDRKLQRSIEAFVQMFGPMNSPGLSVGFPWGTAPYNEDGISQLLEKACTQLRETRPPNSAAEIPLKVIAVWSESKNVDLFGFATEMIGLGPEEIPERYYLFDWIFEYYRDLAAIIFFEMRDTERHEDFWTIPDPEQIKLFPFGLVIINPFLAEVEQALKESLTEYCRIIKGIIKPS